MPAKRKTITELEAENAALRLQLDDAEQALRAIRSGEVDALVLPGQAGDEIFTLRTADEAFRRLVEQMQEGAMLVSEDGPILFANQCVAQMVGTPLETVVGSALDRLVQEDDRPKIKALLAAARTRPARDEVRLATPAKLPVRLAANAVTIDGRETICVVATDLTDQRHREQLAATNLAKDRFIAVLSHELRTPLTPILMTVAMLETDPDLPAQFRGDMAMIRRNIDLETKLIDDLLDLSRVSSGKLRLQLQPTSVHQVLAHAGDNCRGDLTDKKQTIDFDLGATADTVTADPARLQQVFWNLIRNAIKFTPTGGRITVRSVNPSPGRIAVAVQDTGVGIPQDMLSKVFDAFEQGDARVTRQFGGLGLGLAISKAIIDIHDGAISVNSAGSGAGAVFTVELATVKDVASPVAPPQPTPAAAAGYARVLLVEDHPDTATMLTRFLQSHGYQVQTAGSVRAALQLAASGTFDVLVSDLGLPDGSGHELMRQLAQRSPLVGIALSGYGMEQDRKASREAGFAEHLVKPVNADRLEAVIRRLVAAR